MATNLENINRVPVLPLRDLVVFPRMVIPLFIGREKSIKALEQAYKDPQNKKIVLVAQKSPIEDHPKVEELYSVGTLCNILQLLKLPDGTMRVLIEGLQRCQLSDIHEEEEGYLSSETLFPEVNELLKNEKIEVLAHTISVQFRKYVKLNKKIPKETLRTLTDITDYSRLTDMIAIHISDQDAKLPEKQNLLEIFELEPRLEKLKDLLEKILYFTREARRIRSEFKQNIAKEQKAHFLSRQIQILQKELNKSQGGTGSEQEQIATRVKKTKMPKEAKEKALSELSKLEAMPPISAESTVSRNYLETLLSMPWNQRTKINYDLDKAKSTLESSHFGLEKIKTRILESLAVQKRIHSMGSAKALKQTGSILLLVGPPGVGKTSLGMSIAEALSRKFTRISLGGVRDEAEIRGHRRTYIGSMPGQIMQKMAKAGVKNPLFMLDEIDKMAMDFRGDPASALLEVLDPEQNNSFNDHYLDVAFDLSEVLFIATSNTLNIPPPLLDRMEIIRISGYTEGEKMNIAKKYLVPKQQNQHGLKPSELAISDHTLQDIIRYYTREAGVRNLERELAALCRKSVMDLSQKSARKKIVASSRNLEHYLGVKRFRYGLAEQQDQIGQVAGLAWTEVGGELMTIEAAVLPGKGKMHYTGQLGDVMKESIQAAFTVVRSRSEYLGIASNFHENSDIHVHVPEGATPKDGPSAGIGMCTALISTLTKSPVRADIAMTGEITLRGEVLPIGGLKEKLLAAHRGEIREVIIPNENRRDLKEIPKNITQGLIIHPVRWIDEVVALAFRSPPKPLSKKLDSPFNMKDIVLTAQPKPTEAEVVN